MFRDRHSPARIARIEALFEVREQVMVGGNVIVHARARRRRRH